jgi:hypothetical protein
MAGTLRGTAGSKSDTTVCALFDVAFPEGGAADAIGSAAAQTISSAAATMRTFFLNHRVNAESLAVFMI